MSLLAIARPDGADFPLFVHVLGAMILVGGLFAGASSLGLARGNARVLRIGYWSLVALALPGWVVMRIGAAWVYSEEGWDDLPDGVSEPDWLGLSWAIGELGGIVLLIALIVGGIGIRKLEDGRNSWLLKVTLWLSLLLVTANLVAVWAMSGKPGS